MLSTTYYLLHPSKQRWFATANQKLNRLQVKSLQHKEKAILNILFKTIYNWGAVKSLLPWEVVQRCDKEVNWKENEKKQHFAAYYPKRDCCFLVSFAVNVITSCCCFVSLGSQLAPCVQILAHLHATIIWKISAISEKITFFFFYHWSTRAYSLLAFTKPIFQSSPHN